MSIEGPLPSADAAPSAIGARAGAIALLLFAAACGRPDLDSYLLRSAEAGTGRGVAQVRLASCGSDWCESLWLGPSEGEVRQLAMLRKGQHCDEVVWTPDATRVGFLIDGYQLRIYRPDGGTPAGQVSLVEPDGAPTSRVARGVTFSGNGAAITFDDCPRTHSGCKPGMVAVQ